MIQIGKFKIESKKEKTKKRLNIVLMILGLIIIILISVLVGMHFTKSEPDNKPVDKPIGKPEEKPKPDELVDCDLGFELPIEGSSGYPISTINLKEENKAGSQNIGTIPPGDAFKILSESGNWWKVNYKGKIGWVDNRVCMINLPDIIPSIIYDNTNSYGSRFKSSGYDLKDITYRKLYETYLYNNRLERKEYVMPIIYPMAKKIYAVQKAALKNNEALLIYETFRPYDTQMKVANAVTELMKNNPYVDKGINTNGWSISWFIATSVSGHQQGHSVDLTLVKIDETEAKSMGKYKYMEVIDYTPYSMPTDIHELSIRATKFQYPVWGINSWINVPFSSTMTEGAKKLHTYCLNTNLSPLASEWWHFDDFDAKAIMENLGYSSVKGDYFLNGCVSEKYNDLKESK